MWKLTQIVELGNVEVDIVEFGNVEVDEKT
jgi:hypothetical protein